MGRLILEMLCGGKAALTCRAVAMFPSIPNFILLDFLKSFPLELHILTSNLFLKINSLLFWIYR